MHYAISKFSKWLCPQSKWHLQANHALTQEAATAKESADAANIKSDGLQIRIKQCSTRVEQLQTSAHAAETDRVRLQHEQTALQAELKAVSAQKQELEAAADQMYSKLQKLEPILPELARATSKAQKCQEDMSKLSGSQVKVHATIQSQQQQQQELQNSLAAAEHQLSLVTQDYAVCTDVSSTIQTEHDKLQVNSRSFIKCCLELCPYQIQPPYTEGFACT